MFFVRRRQVKPTRSYDAAKKRPVIRSSICTGEQTACFQDLQTGRLEEVMLLRTPADRAEFCRAYGIREEDLTVIY